MIGTTNRKEAIDPALLCAGRMSEHFEFQIPSKAELVDILVIHAKGLGLTIEKCKYLASRTGDKNVGADIARFAGEIRTSALLRAMQEGFFDTDRAEAKTQECIHE